MRKGLIHRLARSSVAPALPPPSLSLGVPAIGTQSQGEKKNINKISKRRPTGAWGLPVGGVLDIMLLLGIYFLFNEQFPDGHAAAVGYAQSSFLEM